MNAAEFLTALQGASNIGGAPFGMDLICLIDALQARGGKAVYVARDDKMAAAALRTAEFIQPSLDIADLPGWDILPYDRVSPSPGVAARRCAGLARLAQHQEGDPPLLVITTASSIVQRVPPLETMKTSSFSVRVGKDVDEAALAKYLAGQWLYSNGHSAREGRICHSRRDHRCLPANQNRADPYGFVRRHAGQNAQF